MRGPTSSPRPPDPPITQLVALPADPSPPVVSFQPTLTTAQLAPVAIEDDHSELLPGSHAFVKAIATAQGRSLWSLDSDPDDMETFPDHTSRPPFAEQSIAVQPGAPKLPVDVPPGITSPQVQASQCSPPPPTPLLYQPLGGGNRPVFRLLVTRLQGPPFP